MPARPLSWFGLTVASCERGDVRQSPNGVFIYDADGRREIARLGEGRMGMLEMNEMYACLVEGKPLVHDGRWGLATLEVCTALLASSAERREIELTHQDAVAR